MPRPRNIGRSELEVLSFIHDHQPASVREVAEHFGRTHGHVRTTVLNVMRRLVQKGYLTRRKVAGIHQYAPCMPKTQMLRGLVRDFVDRALGGSLSPFVAYLAEDARLCERDLSALKRIIEELEKLRQKEGAR